MVVLDGVYFEKNKNQKTRNQFKRKLSTDINKLRSFIPSGEAFISELDLFFPIPLPTYDPIKKQKKIVPHWQSNSIYYYSIKYLKKTKSTPFFYFLKCFKFYRIASESIKSQSKTKLIQLFFKWLGLQANSLDLNDKNSIYLIGYFNFLLKLLLKYEIFESNSDSTLTRYKQSEKFLVTNNIETFLSDNKILQLFLTYDRLINKSQQLVNIQLTSQLLLVAKQPQNWLLKMKTFSFLNQQLSSTLPKLNSVLSNLQSENLQYIFL